MEGVYYSSSIDPRANRNLDQNPPDLDGIYIANVVEKYPSFFDIVFHKISDVTVVCATDIYRYK